MQKFWLISMVCASMALSGCETMGKIENSLNSINLPKLSSITNAVSPSQDKEKSNDYVSSGGEGCPQVKGLKDLSRITIFPDYSQTPPTQMVSSTMLEKINSSCLVSQNSVSIDLELDFKGTLGPLGIKDLNGQANYTYPYFLSVISPDGQIMSKDVFALPMIYENGQITYFRQDKIRQVIPLMAGQSAEKFQIVMGFQLLPEQLLYNRQLKPE